MKKRISLLLVLLMTISLLPACKQKQKVTPVASSMTIGELKTAYKVSTVQEQNEMSPFWNMEQKTTFTIHFNSKVEPALAVTVHTDPKCGPNSRVGQLNAAYLCDDGVDVVVKPGLATLSDNRNEAMWGNAPIYFLSINYDRFSSEVKKLDTPVVVPFTVKTTVSTPTVEGRINNQGQFYLTWTPVDKATSYEIYESGVGLRSEDQDDLKAYTRSELGYVGDHIKKIGEVEGTTFEDFSYSNSDKNYTQTGDYVTMQNSFLPLTYYVRAKNKDGETGNYSMAVEAWKFSDKLPDSVELQDFAEFPETVSVKMKDGSYASMPVNFKKESGDSEKARYSYSIPGTILTGYVYKTAGDFPEEKKSAGSVNYGIYEVSNSESIIPAVNVKALTENQKKIITPDEERTLTTYSSDMRMAVAEMENVRLLNDGIYEKTMEDLIAEYGSIYGGAYEPEPSGQDNPSREDGQNDTAEEPSDQEQPADDQEQPADNPEQPANDPEDEEQQPAEENPEQPANPEQPDEDNPEQPAEPETPAEPAEEPSDEPVERPENPDIGDANSNPVPDTAYRVFADSAEEEYLARCMISAQNEIDLSAFPSLQNPTYLVDTLTKVIFQNPYILSADAYSYDGASKTLIIEYALSAEDIFRRQKEINSATTSILSSCIKEGMTDEEKVMAIWNKLENDTVYDTAACEAAEKTNFTGISAEYADAFNTYGIMCKKKGVCQSYAMAYKLLLIESGIDAKVLTGYLNKTLPHAWSIINLGGKWYWFDVTNNAKTAGIPYLLYEASSDNAKSQDYVLDESYDLDTNLSWVNNSDDTRNFYVKNNLYVDDISKVPDKIVAARAFKRQGAYAVLVKGGIREEQINQVLLQAIGEKLLASGMKSEELSKLRIGYYRSYLFFQE